MVLISWLWADSSILLGVDYLLQRRLYLPAYQRLEEIIGQGYQDENAYALRGYILSLRGRYSDALIDYEYGLASERTWHREGEAYATTLRLLWACEDAQEKRELLREFGSFSSGAKLRLYAEQIHDLRYCGQMDRAWALHIEMEGRYPQASLTHLVAAELWLDGGDLDSAYQELWLSQRLLHRGVWQDIVARIALMEGRYEEAYRYMQYIGVQRVADRVLIRFALSALLANDPTAVVHKTSLLRWSGNENPVLMYLRLQAFEALGDREAYSQEEEWFTLICDPDCQRRVRWSIQKELGFAFDSAI